jgi:hypothetical protein
VRRRAERYTNVLLNKRPGRTNCCVLVYNTHVTRTHLVHRDPRVALCGNIRRARSRCVCVHDARVSGLRQGHAQAPQATRTPAHGRGSWRPDADKGHAIRHVRARERRGQSVPVGAQARQTGGAGGRHERRDALYEHALYRLRGPVQLYAVPTLRSKAGQHCARPHSSFFGSRSGAVPSSLSSATAVSGIPKQTNTQNHDIVCR